MSDDGYETLCAYIAERKKTEFEARKRTEDRGSTIVASSGALVAFIFGLTVLVGGTDQGPKVTSPVAVLVLLVAMALFVIAVALGIFVQNSTWRSTAATTETLRNFVRRNDAWGMTKGQAARICADTDIDVIESLGRATGVKARIATIALCFQGLAGILTIIAVVTEFASRGWLVN